MRRSNASTDGGRPAWWRGLRHALADDRGSASIEFLVGGLLLLVPVAYLVVALGLVQSGALGVEAAARHTARAIGTASDATDAERRAELILADVGREYGLPAETLEIDLACAGASASCPDAGETLTVTVRARIPLPLVPPVLGLDDLTSIPVEAQAVQKTSRLWGSGP
ncbi:TadE family protein [Microbacterium sp. GXF7504]